MKELVDSLNESAVDAVMKSGLAKRLSRSAVVIAVRSDFTVDVHTGNDEILTERVRVLGYGVEVGDSVTILRTAGGWVCLGVQMGTYSTQWTNFSLASWQQPFGNGFRQPRYRRIGSAVEMEGVVEFKQDVGGGQMGLFYLSGDCSPPMRVALTVSRSSGNFCQLVVEPDGLVRTHGAPPLAAASWLVVDARFSLR
ncbi:hypothetical protein LHJ74_30725 [Streptomyces sp. N2-109]|uniref:Uncharacterized protein n=1 Tax=Streptomyces gossypii TaxID=2883101 RepID=A0ABT2K227_9ACTN|nr:hypothetical protein [Streptomyces gossypii]MCT2594231.1 hypothetical protein [Streptomyces gossypii]